MKATVFEYRNQRYAIIEEPIKTLENIKVLKVDYLVSILPAFCDDYEVKTYNKDGECFSLSSLGLILKYKDKQRLRLLHNSSSYEIFKHQKNTYLMIGAPKVLNKYKVNKKELYLISFDNKIYLWSLFSLTDKEISIFRKRKPFDYYIDYSDKTIETLHTSIINTYLIELLNLPFDKQLNIKCFFNRNLLVEIEDIKYLFKGYLPK